MKTRYIFTFPTQVINEPITYNLIKNFNLKLNIFNAYINSGEEGNLAIELEGEKEFIKKGIEYAGTKGVLCTPLEKKIFFQEEKCVHCGACTAVFV